MTRRSDPRRCGQCKKLRVPDDLSSVLGPECLEHDSCETCAKWCYAYNDQDCEHGAVYRSLAELRDEIRTLRRDGVLTASMKDLGDMLGCPANATADGIAERARSEIQRLRSAVSAYHALACYDD